jgi:hypothetical protein
MCHLCTGYAASFTAPRYGYASFTRNRFSPAGCSWPNVRSCSILKDHSCLCLCPAALSCSLASFRWLLRELSLKTSRRSSSAVVWTSAGKTCARLWSISSASLIIMITCASQCPLCATPPLSYRTLSLLSPRYALSILIECEACPLMPWGQMLIEVTSQCRSTCCAKLKVCPPSATILCSCLSSLRTDPCTILSP